MIGPRSRLASARSSVVTVAAIATAVFTAACGESWAQCAMCGTTVNSASDPLGKGMFLSILLMLAVPNLLIASVGGWLFYTYRRAYLAQAASAAAAAASAGGDKADLVSAAVPEPPGGLADRAGPLSTVGEPT